MRDCLSTEQAQCYVPSDENRQRRAVIQQSHSDSFPWRKNEQPGGDEVKPGLGQFSALKTLLLGAPVQLHLVEKLEINFCKQATKKD